MKIFTVDRFELPLPMGHRFPLDKYRRLRQRVESMPEFARDELVEPDRASMKDVLRAHSPEYLDRLLSGGFSPAEIRRIGFPWSPELVERAFRSCGGTIAACRSALEDGVSVNLSGGTHHAFADAGEGYCLLNDSVTAARSLMADTHVRRVMVIDCDVHQGNGTAALVRHDPDIFAFSIHGARNFPARKETGDCDIALPDGADDRTYLNALIPVLVEHLDRFQPDLAIYLAGADPFVGDRFGRLALSKAGLMERDREVLHACGSRGIPVAITMAGGYAVDIADIVDIHANTVRTAGIIWSG